MAGSVQITTYVPTQTNGMSWTQAEVITDSAGNTVFVGFYDVNYVNESYHNTQEGIPADWNPTGPKGSREYSEYTSEYLQSHGLTRNAGSYEAAYNPHNAPEYSSDLSVFERASYSSKQSQKYMQYTESVLSNTVNADRGNTDASKQIIDNYNKKQAAKTQQPVNTTEPINLVEPASKPVETQAKPPVIKQQAPDILTEIDREATPDNSAPSYNFNFNLKHNFEFEGSNSKETITNPQFTSKENDFLNWDSGQTSGQTSETLININSPKLDLTNTAKTSLIPEEEPSVDVTPTKQTINLGTGINPAEQSKRELTGQNNQNRQTIKNQVAVIDDQNIQLEKQAQQLTSQKGTISDLTQENRELTGKTNQYIDLINDQASVINKQKGQISGLTGIVENQSQQIRELTGQKNQYAEDIKSLQISKQYQADVAKAEAYDAMYEKRIAQGKTNQQISLLNQELDTTQTEVQNTQVALAYAQDQARAQAYEDMYAARIQQGHRNQEVASQLNAKDQEIAARDEEIDHLETTLRTEQVRYNQLQESFDDAQARLDRVQDWEERIQADDEATRQTNRALTLRGQNTPITKLINSGADAQVNLFEVTIYAGQGQTEFSSIDNTELSKNVTFRINTFNAPEKQLQVQDVVYQSGSFPKVMVSSGITRQLDFTIRIDSNYEIYWFMHGIFAGDSSGNFDLGLYDNLDNKYISRIVVKALKPNPVLTLSDSDSYYQTTDGYDIIYSWTFFDCILVKIPQVALDMGNSGPITGVYSFKFGAMQEGLGTKGIMNTIDETQFFSVQTRDSLLDETRGTPELS